MLIKKYYSIIFFILSSITFFIKSSQQVPVIFVDVGDSKHLNDSLMQAKSCNDRVILIGNERNNNPISSKIELFSIADYQKSSNYFRTLYRHMSSVDYEIEIAHFTRWFILEEFMRINQLEIAFYVESGVMLYDDLSKDYKLNLSDGDCALEVQNGFFSGSISLWHYRTIKSFCSFLKRFYENTAELDNLEDHFNLGGEQYHDDWPHISNWIHQNDKKFKVKNLSALINNSTYDTSLEQDYILVPNAASILEYRRYKTIPINVTNNYYNKKKQQLLIKDILWNKGMPYCYNSDLARFIQFKSLKFQGFSADLIQQYKSIPQLQFFSHASYKSINALPFYLLGFFGEENKKYLENFIKTQQPKVIVDLGSWLGASASFMAFLMPEDGKLYAIDHFDTLLDKSCRDNNIKKISGKTTMSELYHQFLSNIIHYRLNDKIIPVQLGTREAAHQLCIGAADLIYVDASTNEEEIYQDILDWYPKLNKGGIICGDNWKWFASVQRGVTKAAAQLNRTVKTDNNFWYFD